MQRVIIPNRLKYARLNAGYSQNEVVRQSGFMTRRALGNYETGYTYPGNKVLYFLPKLYHVSLDYLFCEDPYATHEDFVENVLRLNNNSIITLKNLRNENIPLDDLKTFINTFKEEDN